MKKVEVKAACISGICYAQRNDENKKPLCAGESNRVLRRIVHFISRADKLFARGYAELRGKKKRRATNNDSTFCVLLAAH